MSRTKARGGPASFSAKRKRMETEAFTRTTTEKNIEPASKKPKPSKDESCSEKPNLGETEPSRKSIPNEVKSSSKVSRSSEAERPKQKRDNVDESIAMMDASLLVDHFAKALRRHSPDLTEIEIEDRYIPAKAFKLATNFTGERLAPNLPEFLIETTANGRDALEQCAGATKTHTLIITSSGIRTADIVREVRSLTKGDVSVGKYIGKHMKLKDNLAYAKKKNVNIAVSAAKRMKDLIDGGGIDPFAIQRIVIDGSFLDEKKRTIFDMTESFSPLVELLNMEAIKSRLSVDKNKLDIIVF